MSLSEFINPETIEFWAVTYPTIGAFWGRIGARSIWKDGIKRREQAIEANKVIDADNDKIQADYYERYKRGYKTYYGPSLIDKKRVKSLSDIRDESLAVFTGVVVAWPFVVAIVGGEKAWKLSRHPRENLGKFSVDAATRLAVGKPAVQEFNKQAYKELEARNAELEKELGLDKDEAVA
jgi:hypothetical protein